VFVPTFFLYLINSLKLNFSLNTSTSDAVNAFPVSVTLTFILLSISSVNICLVLLINIFDTASSIRVICQIFHAIELKLLTGLYLLFSLVINDNNS